MPYKKIGTKVYKKEGGKLVKVGTSTKAKIKHYLNTLRAVEHNPNWKPTKK